MKAYRQMLPVLLLLCLDSGLALGGMVGDLLKKHAQEHAKENPPLDEAAIRQKQRDTIRRQRELSRKNMAHDNAASGANLTRCTSLSRMNSEIWRNQQEYHRTHQAQSLGGIRAAIDRLGDEMNLNDVLENRMNSNAGSQFGQAGQAMTRDMLNERARLTREMNRFADEKRNLQADLQRKISAISSACQSDPAYSCSPQDSRILAQIDSLRQRIANKQREYDNAKNRRNRYHDRRIENQQQNIQDAAADLQRSDADNEAGVWSHSGCQMTMGGRSVGHQSVTAADAARVGGMLENHSFDNLGRADASVSAPSTGQVTSNVGEGNGSVSCELMGAIVQRDTQLRAAFEATTRQAEDFARAKVARLQRVEDENKHQADYRLFELALLDAAEAQRRGLITALGKSVLESNLQVMAATGAAAKNLHCTKKGAVDAKSYHLFRAAAATFLIARINDTAYYGGNSDCIAVERFSGDPNDEQVKIVERATNIYEQRFADMCLRVDPQDPALKRKCLEHLDKVFGPNPQYRNMPRTREYALQMFEAAHDAAQVELQTKMKLVRNAHSQVEKGKRYVQQNIQKLAVSIALKVAAKALEKQFESLWNFTPCGPHTPGRCQPSLLSKFMAWRAKFNKYYIMEIYYGAQIVRWTIFTNKWKKKLRQARVYTHLACNEQDARQEHTTLARQMQESETRAAREIARARQQAFSEAVRRLNGTLKEKGVGQEVTPRQKGQGGKIKNPKSSFVPAALKLIGALFFPRAKASLSGALGLARGTGAFREFMQRRNRAWFLQAQDVGSHVNLDITTAPVDLRPLDGKTDPYNKPMEKVGFPIPETRLATTGKMVNLVRENLMRTEQALAEVSKQHDHYVDLLRDMKIRFKLGVKGMTDMPQLPVKKFKFHCATNKGGTFVFDEKCDCKKSGTCATFTYPEIKGITAESKTEANLARDTANAMMRGDLAAADRAGKALAQARRDVWNRQNKETGQAKKSFIGSDTGKGSGWAGAGTNPVLKTARATGESGAGVAGPQGQGERMKGKRASGKKNQADDEQPAKKKANAALSAKKGKSGTSVAKSPGQGVRKRGADIEDILFDDEFDGGELTAEDADSGAQQEGGEQSGKRNPAWKESNWRNVSAAHMNIFKVITRKYHKVAPARLFKPKR